MKKIYLYLALFLGVCSLLGVAFFMYITSSSDTQEKQTTLAQEQTVQVVEKTDITEPEISEETQRQLDQINTLFEKKVTEYQDKLEKTLWKYNMDFTQEDINTLSALLQESQNLSQTQKLIEEKLGISMLNADIRVLLKSEEIYDENKENKAQHLEFLQKQTETTIQENNEEIFSLIIDYGLQNYSALSEKSRESILSTTLLQIENNPDFLDMSQAEKGKLLQQYLSLSLNRHSGLNSEMKSNLKNKILQDFQENNLIIISDTSDLQSFFFPGRFIAQSFAYSSEEYNSLLAQSIRELSDQTDLTDIQKQILRLQIEILIDSLIRSEIENEIQNNPPNEANMTLLGEFSALKATLVGPDEHLSLSEIQGFQLGNYIDDSEDISGLDPLAYISSKSGHVIITNLAGGSYLGKENSPLYPGYKVSTPSSAETTIVFVDESVLRLESDSLVDITGDPTDIQIGVEEGGVWARVVKPLLTGDTFSIEGNGTSLGVRGTSLYFSAEDNSAYIIDSYHPTDEESIDIMGNSVNIITAGEDGNTKESILENNQKLGRYIREDLVYLELLKDDRERGFFGNPLGQKYSGAEFIEKLNGEINVSTPNPSESNYVFENSEIQNISATQENIFELVIKDRLISEIRSPDNVGNITSKINAVKDLDFENLQNTLENKRAVQNRIDFGITEEILSTPDFSSSQLQDMFINYDLPEKINEKEILLTAAQELSETTNGGNSIVKDDFSLTGSMLVSGKKISVNWESSNENIIKIQGDTAERVLSLSASSDVVLTATLSLGNQSIKQDILFNALERELGDEEKLEQAAEILGEYLNTNSFPFTFDAQTPLNPLVNNPQYFKDIGISPTISFTPRLEIKENGEVVNQPKYNDFNTDTDEHLENNSRQRYIQVEAILSYQGKSFTGSYNPVLIEHESCEENDLLLGNGENASCYELLASAEYDTHGDLELNRIKEGGNIQGDQSGITVENACDSLLGNYLGGNCDWTSASIIESKFGYDANKVTIVDKNNSFIEYDGETGIILDNGGVGQDYLSYDLSSLDLGDDWAIEMSVRGEDLSRDDGYYSLMNIPGIIKLYSIKPNTFIPDYGFGIYQNTGNYNLLGTSFPTGYQKIYLEKNSSNYTLRQNNLVGAISVTGSNNNVYIGSSSSNTEQWNGIINYLKIFKIKE